MTYGKSGRGNYAVAAEPHRHNGTWDAVEAVGEFYRIIDVDDVPEDDWDRLDALEKEALAAQKDHA
jgi:hypothetical protein